LPIGAVKKIADTGNIQLTIVTGFGTITLSQALLTEALKSTSSGNLKINITPLDKQDINIIGVLSGNVKNVFNISITVDGNIVTEFGSQKIKISLPYTLNGTEKSEGLCVYYIDGTGKVSLMAGTQYDSKTKQITFETNHLSFYAVGYDDGALSKLFTDVSGKHWAKDAIGYVVGKGYFNGTSDTKFEPENAMTRSMFVTVIGRVYSEDLSTTGGGFTDVPNAKWYTQSVNWAAGNGIVSGVASDKFAPESPVTREQMAAFMYRYAQWAGYDMTVSKTKNLDAFNDAGEVSSWAKDAMIWAVDKGLISGVTTNTLEPRTSATRAQVGAIVQRFAENVIPADKVISGEASSQKSTASNSSSSSKSTDPYTTVPSSGTYLTVKGSGLVNKIYLTESNLRGLGTQDVTYTGRNKEDDNARQFVLFTCVDITKILNAAGYKGTATTLRVTCADGFTKNYNLSEIMNDCVAFTNTSTPTNYWVPASVALLSDGTFRLVYGQEATDTDDAKSFNMLGWAKDLKEIEIY